MKFNNHETDLYILPESESESRRVIEVLDSIPLGYEVSRSDVKGQPWYGKKFIDVPFCYLWKERIVALMEGGENK